MFMYSLASDYFGQHIIVGAKEINLKKEVKTAIDKLTQEQLASKLWYNIVIDSICENTGFKQVVFNDAFWIDDLYLEKKWSI